MDSCCSSGASFTIPHFSPGPSVESLPVRTEIGMAHVSLSIASCRLSANLPESSAVMAERYSRCSAAVSADFGGDQRHEHKTILPKATFVPCRNTRGFPISGSEEASGESSDLVDRLAAHRTLGAAPREELE